MSNTEINQVLANSLSPGELPFPGSPRGKNISSPLFSCTCTLVPHAYIATLGNR